jgi:hypothetical protein
LVYFVALWDILWLFGVFFLFWYVVPRKIWQPCSEAFSVSSVPMYKVNEKKNEKTVFE